MSSSITGIARSSVPYGLPIVAMHRILVRSALDPSSADHRAPLNVLHHSGGPVGRSDLPFVGLGEDTSCSWAWLDLRGGPVLVRIPGLEPERSISAQVVDLYTDIVGHVPLGAAGDGGTLLVRGPAGGEAGREVGSVLESPTHLALLLVRTQLMTDEGQADAEALLAGIAVTPLGEAPPFPATVPAVDVRAALGPQFLFSLRWMLEFMPTLPEDVRIREELSGLGIGVGLLDQVLAEPTIAQEVTEGLALGIQDVRSRCAALTSPGELHGSREPVAGDYLTRAARAYLRILGDNPGEVPAAEVGDGSSTAPSAPRTN